MNSSRLDELRNNLHDCPDRYIISEYAVYYALSQLNVSKSTGPDLIENKLLKNLAVVLAAPVCSLINLRTTKGGVI